MSGLLKVGRRWRGKQAFDLHYAPDQIRASFPRVCGGGGLVASALDRRAVDAADRVLDGCIADIGSNGKRLVVKPVCEPVGRGNWHDSHVSASQPPRVWRR